MNVTNDRLNTSGRLNMVFDELAPIEEPKEEDTKDKTVSKIKKELEDTRLSEKSLRTPPTFGDEDDVFDDESIHDSIATSTPIAGLEDADVEMFFGNKSVAGREEEAAPPAPPPPTPKQVPSSAANSSIVWLSDNHERRLYRGADEIRSAIVANEAETTGILKRRRSEIIRKGDINPWDETLRKGLVESVRAPINMHEFQERAPKIQANRDFEIGGEVFHIQTLIGQGGYAKVYKALNKEKKVVAVKYEVPSCFWEVYICDQMRNRLIKDREDRVKMADWCIMKVMDAYVFSTASILVNEYHEYGTLLEYANSIKEPNWHLLLLAHPNGSYIEGGTCL
ncbi:hypothetical protein L3Y34_015163 [Caenorhabditis briggsae]|nr:hypothetical protein L3Y34_015163 [Caenorhabditis briggsae]